MTTPVQTPAAASAVTIGGSFNAGLQQGLHPAPPSPSPAANTATGVASAAGNVAGQTAATGAEGAGVIGNALRNPGEVVSDVTAKSKSFWESLDIGKILGGILGLGGAFFLGNMFGDGMFSTILMVCLAIPLMCIGSNQFGGMINGLFGKKPDAQQQPALAPEIAATQQGVAQAQQNTPAMPQTAAGTQAPHQGNGQQVLAAPDVPAGFQRTLSEVEVNAMLENARRAGQSTTNLLMGAPGKEVRIPVADVREDFAQCRAQGYDSVLGLTQNSGTGSITPTCLPLPQAVNSPRR